MKAWRRMWTVRCLWSVLLLSAFIGGCRSAESVAPRERLQKLEITLAKADSSPTEVVVRLMNQGQVPVAVCPCVGPPHRFVVFDLYHEDEARRVGYPEVLFTSGGLRRFYRCLNPGESVDVALNLKAWRPMWGEYREASPIIDLFVGPGHYRVQARYVDSGKRGWRRCKGFSGEVASDWLGLDIRE